MDSQGEQTFCKTAGLQQNKMDYFTLFQNSTYHALNAAKLTLLATTLLHTIKTTSAYPAYAEVLKNQIDLEERIVAFCWHYPLDQLSKIIHAETETIINPLVIYAQFIGALIPQYQQLFQEQSIIVTETDYPNLPDMFFYYSSVNLINFSDCHSRQSDPLYAKGHKENVKEYLALLGYLDKLVAEPKELLRRRWGNSIKYRQNPALIHYILQGVSKEGIVEIFHEHWKIPIEPMPSRVSPKYTSFYQYAMETPPIGWENHFRKYANVLANVEKVLHKLMPQGMQDLCPDYHKVFMAYEKTALQRVRVVILGQDAYHDTYMQNGIVTKYATGLSFSIPSSAPINSFKQQGVKTYRKCIDIILQEVRDNYPNGKYASNGSLEKWADQGVMLLNACLTTEVGDSSKAGAHKDIWTEFILRTIDAVIEANPKVIFLLWGQKSIYFDTHYLSRNVLRFTAPHPSPLNCRGEMFPGCQHFKKVNDKLDEWGLPPIDWSLA
jgi:uracil-DNA glycosylase